VIDWLLPTLINVAAVGAMGVVMSRSLRTLTWRNVVFPTAGAYLLVSLALAVFGDAGLGLDGDWGWALASGALIVTVFVSMNLALGSGEASKVIAFSASYPAITLVLAAVAVGEAVEGGRWLGTVLVVAGAAIIALGDRGPLRPEDAATSWRWLLPTVIFTAGLGVIGVTSRLALETMSWQDLMVWAAIFYCTLAGFVFARERARGEQPVRANGWAVVAGVLAAGSLATLYVALGNGEASVVIPVSASFPIITLLLAWLLLGERLTMLRSAGTLAVIAGVVVITAV
jgi:transporter family protein